MSELTHRKQPRTGHGNGFDHQEMPTLSLRVKLPPAGHKAGGGVAGGWKLLATAAAMYAILIAATQHAFAVTPHPLPSDAAPGLFSEGRALDTVRHLADVIGHRQVSTPGEEAGAVWLLRQVQAIAAVAAASRPDLEVIAVREQATGAIGLQTVFKFEIANVYNNLTNIVLRVAPVGSTAPAVLVNAHNDSTLGTAGASDAASCVGVALELARTLVANASLALPAPIVFLFNGGEETLMQASHGFMGSSRFAKGLGAFINLESTGPWGPDVVFQHTGDWTLRAYARTAPAPRGTTVAQDFFELGLIPADTDYRMFSYRHYGQLPGIDVAFIFDGTAYHTARDETERIRAGTLQAMGENMQGAMLEFAKVLGQHGGSPPVDAASPSGHVYFDLLSRAMVIYSHRAAAIAHNAPLAVLLSLSLAAAGGGGGSWLAARVPPPPALLRHALTALLSALSSLLVPAAVGAVRALVSGVPMVWYGRPRVAYTIYLPAAAAGLLMPYAFPRSSSSSSKGGSAAAEEARAQSLGTALLYSLVASALTFIGMHSAYLFVGWSLGALAAALLAPRKGFSWSAVAAVAASFAAPAAVTLPTAMSICDHVMEKIGLAGAAPKPVPDAVIGIVAGTAVYLALGALLPYLVAAGGRSVRTLVALLLAASLLAAVWASVGVSHPYSPRHPKRVIVQHIHRHTPQGRVTESLFTFSSMDPVPVDASLPPAIAAAPAVPFSNYDWVALYPINYLVTGVARVAPPPPRGARAPTLTLAPAAAALPQRVSALVGRMRSAAAAAAALVRIDGDAGGAVVAAGAQEAARAGEPAVSAGCTRRRLVLDTVLPGWGVMNITGDVAAWSLAPDVASTPLPQGGSCHMTRYASSQATTRFFFWVDTPSHRPLRVELFVKHLQPTQHTAAVVAAVPDWVSATAVTTWQSVWTFE